MSNITTTLSNVVVAPTLIAARFNNERGVVATYEDDDGAWHERAFLKGTAPIDALRMAQIDALTFGWTSEQIDKATEVAKAWDTSGRQVRAWSSPLAMQYDGIWEFYIISDVNGPSGEPDEIRDLDMLAG